MKTKRITILVSLATGCLLAGCATQKFAGINEYKHLTAEGASAVRAALQSLEPIGANTGRCAPSLIARFEREVQRLQVNSIRIRARGRAIQARGDAYFASWSESITNISDPRVREAADHFHPELEASFSRIKLASQRAGAAFDTFSSGLKKLRVELETKAGDIDNGPDRELVRKTTENGRQVLNELAIIDSELLAMKKMLSSSRSNQAR